MVDFITLIFSVSFMTNVEPCYIFIRSVYNHQVEKKILFLVSANRHYGIRNRGGGDYIVPEKAVYKVPKMSFYKVLYSLTRRSHYCVYKVLFSIFSILSKMKKAPLKKIMLMGFSTKIFCNRKSFLLFSRYNLHKIRGGNRENPLGSRFEEKFEFKIQSKKLTKDEAEICQYME